MIKVSASALVTYKSKGSSGGTTIPILLVPEKV